MTEPVPYPENRLRDTAVGERPQERLEQFGPGALSDTELLAMLLRSGTRGMDVLSLANRLVTEAGSLAGLTLWLEDDFRRHRGIGRIKALQLVTVMEIAKRILHQQSGSAPHLDGADLIAQLPANSLLTLALVSGGMRTAFAAPENKTGPRPESRGDKVVVGPGFEPGKA